MPIETVPANARRLRYLAGAGQTAFPFDFPVFEATDLDVRRFRGGLETPLLFGSDYTVQGAGEQGGGTILLAAGAVAGDLVVVRSNQANARGLIVRNGGDLRAEALLAEWNRAVIAMQQLEQRVAQTLRLGPSDPTDAPELPAPYARANMVLGFGAAGELAMIPRATLGGGAYQQGGAGAVARTIQDELALKIHPRQFGGAGDGSADDTAAVQLAANLAGARGAFLDLDDGIWRVSAGIVVPGSARGLRMTGEIVYAGPGGEPALWLGDGAGANNQAKRYEGIRVRRLVQSDWSNEADIGVRMRNFDSCFASIRQAEGFTIGVQAIGENRGFEDSSIELGRLANNKIALDLRAESAGSWNNSCRWIGGHFANASATNPTQPRFGVRLSKGAGGYNLHNAHQFVAPAFELQNQGGAVDAIPFLVEVNARGIHAQGMRIEGNSPTVAWHTADAVDCRYEVAFSSNGAITGNEGNAYLLEVRYGPAANRAGAIVTAYHQAAAAQHAPRLVAGIPAMRAAAFRWSATEVGFEGMAVLSGNPAGPPTTLSGLAFPGLDGFAMLGDAVGFGTSRALVFVVNCALCKDFLIAQDGSFLRACVMLFDGAETVLGSAERPLLSNQALAWNAGAQWWAGTADMEDATYTRLQRVTVPAAAQLAAIGVVSSDPAAVLRSLRLYCPGIHAPPVLAGGGRRWGSRELWASAAWDPPSIAAGGNTVLDVALPDCRPGDFVEASIATATILPVDADTASSGTVRARISNTTGAAVDLSATTVFVRAVKPRA